LYPSPLSPVSNRNKACACFTEGRKTKMDEKEVAVITVLAYEDVLGIEQSLNYSEKSGYLD
jgi:hypothetical protein